MVYLEETSDREIRRRALKVLGPFFGAAGLILTAIIFWIGMLGPATAILALTTCVMLLCIPFLAMRARTISIYGTAAILLIAVTMIQSALTSNGIMNSGSFLVCVLPVAASAFLGNRSAVLFLVISVLFVIGCVVKYHIAPSAEELAVTTGQIYSKSSFYLVATVGAFATALTLVAKNKTALSLLRAAERKASLVAEKARSEQVKAVNEAQAKIRFLAEMSREIRMPLNDVIGMARSLDAEDISNDQRRMVSTILASGQSLTTVLEEVDDLSRIDADKMEIHLAEHDLHDTLLNIEAEFQRQAMRKGLGLGVEIASSVPQFLRFDVLRVRQCIGNLLANALCYTDRGQVSLSVSAIPDHQNGCIVTVRVEDTGIGFNAAEAETLFRPFSHAEGSKHARRDGVGLGLTITRKLARLMGGDVVAHSRPGAGAIFTFTFRGRL